MYTCIQLAEEAMLGVQYLYYLVVYPLYRTGTGSSLVEVAILFYFKNIKFFWFCTPQPESFLYTSSYVDRACPVQNDYCTSVPLGYAPTSLHDLLK